MPGEVAEFKRITMAPGQHFQQIDQAVQIQLPVWRQLKQNWSKFLAQQLDAGQKIHQRPFRFPEFDAMGEKAARLNGIDETFGCDPFPGLECGLSGQTVKAVVQLHGIEVTRIVIKQPGGTNLSGVKRPAPMLIVPTGSANADLASHM